MPTAKEPVRQAAAVCMFLRFFRLGVLALSERQVQRLVAAADADRPAQGHST